MLLIQENTLVVASVLVTFYLLSSNQKTDFLFLQTLYTVLGLDEIGSKTKPNQNTRLRSITPTADTFGVQR